MYHRYVYCVFYIDEQRKECMFSRWALAPSRSVILGFSLKNGLIMCALWISLDVSEVLDEFVFLFPRDEM